jgi:hypothetical protein
MGRQFNYYCHPEDLDQIQEEVFIPLGSRLIEAINPEGGRTMQDQRGKRESVDLEGIFRP